MEKSDLEKFPVPSAKDYRYDNVNLDDPRIWSAYSRGDTIGVFQVETDTCRPWCRQIKPKNISDLADVISVVRPGPLRSGESDLYVKRKDGKEEITYLHPALEPILKDTYGIICYQEQCMRIAMDIAGFTESEAMTLVKAISKKLPEVIAKLKGEFIEKAIKKAIVSKEIAEEIFEIMRRFQRYGFNKCLSKDTIVETKDGLKILDDVQIGDFVKFPKTSKKDGFTEILDKIDSGNKDLYEIELNSGKTVKCTMDHKFLCSDGQKHDLYDILLNNYKIMCED